MNQGRRSAIRCASAAALAGAALLLRPSMVRARGHPQAFDAGDVATAFTEIGIDAKQTGDLVLEIAELAEDATSVPVELLSNVPGTSTLHLFVDRNPYPYIARFDVPEGTLPFASLRIRVAERSPVRLVARAAGQDYMLAKRVHVVAGGCSAGDAQEQPQMPAEAKPMKIRATLNAEGIADVRVLVSHPMENGLRPDAGGKLVPAHFIRTLSAQLNGRTVFDARLGRSVSSNPLIGLKLRGAKLDDVVKFSWEDSLGLKRADEAKVTASLT